jgi:hypothetical protein
MFSRVSLFESRIVLAGLILNIRLWIYKSYYFFVLRTHKNTYHYEKEHKPPIIDIKSQRKESEKRYEDYLDNKRC